MDKCQPKYKIATPRFVGNPEKVCNTVEPRNINEKHPVYFSCNGLYVPATSTWSRDILVGIITVSWLEYRRPIHGNSRAFLLKPMGSRQLLGPTQPEKSVTVVLQRGHFKWGVQLITPFHEVAKSGGALHTFPYTPWMSLTEEAQVKLNI